MSTICYNYIGISYWNLFFFPPHFDFYFISLSLHSSLFLYYIACLSLDFYNIKNTLQIISTSTMQPISQFSMEEPTYYDHYTPSSPIHQNQPFIDPYFLSILNYQNQLNFELLRNQNLIASYMNFKKDQDATKNGQTASSTSDHFSNQNQNQQYFHFISHLSNANSQQIDDFSSIPAQRPQKAEKSLKKVKKIIQDSEYEPQISEEENYKFGKSSESKNVPKNFSKAILLFMKKKQNLIKKIVEQLGLNYKQLIVMTQGLKGKVNSIAQLRSLWVDKQNKFAKVFRIISCLYIKRYSLQHIFNSRVEDYSKHLKYRNKLAQVLKNPSEFTSMKDY